MDKQENESSRRGGGGRAHLHKGTRKSSTTRASRSRRESLHVLCLGHGVGQRGRSITGGSHNVHLLGLLKLLPVQYLWSPRSTTAVGTAPRAHRHELQWLRWCPHTPHPSLPIGHSRPSACLQHCTRPRPKKTPLPPSASRVVIKYGNVVPPLNRSFPNSPILSTSQPLSCT
jgi:hypothetical protein